MVAMRKSIVAHVYIHHERNERPSSLFISAISFVQFSFRGGGKMERARGYRAVKPEYMLFTMQVMVRDKILKTKASTMKR